jgi:hypothetical protein
MLVLAGLLAVVPSAAARADGNVNFFLGQKFLNSDWEDDESELDLSEQGEIGALFSWRGRDWPVYLAFDILGSSDEETVGGVDFKGSTGEFDFGVRWQSTGRSVRPFFGGGLAFVGGELEVDLGGPDLEIDDDAMGLWVDGGVVWRLGKRFNLGFEGRFTKAELEADFGGESVDIEGGGVHLGMLLGFGWGE